MAGVEEPGDGLVVSKIPGSVTDDVRVTLTVRRLQVEEPNDLGFGPWIPERPDLWCPACSSTIHAGQEAWGLGGSWLHVECARARLTSQSWREAWLTIAAHVAARPSAHSAATVRASLSHLAEMCRADDGEERS